jgi:hypothetical protein
MFVPSVKPSVAMGPTPITPFISGECPAIGSISIKDDVDVFETEL